MVVRVVASRVVMHPMMMVARRREGSRGNQHQQKDSERKLFHASRVAPEQPRG
jgi:hypothetical protein